MDLGSYSRVGITFLGYLVMAGHGENAFTRIALIDADLGKEFRVNWAVG